MNDRERIGSLLSSIRESCNKTQQDISDITGVDRANISKLEKGKYNVGIDILSKVADALNCEITITKKKRVRQP